LIQFFAAGFSVYPPQEILIALFNGA
jgi:hypothetical protein